MDMFSTVQEHAKSIDEVIEISHGLEFVNEQDNPHFIYNTNPVSYDVDTIKDTSTRLIPVLSLYQVSAVQPFLKQSSKIKDFGLMSQIADQFSKYPQRETQLTDHLLNSFDLRYTSQLIDKQSNIIRSSRQEFEPYITEQVIFMQIAARRILNRATEDINYIHKEAHKKGWLSVSADELEQAYNLPGLKRTKPIIRKGSTA
jgi:hypothetical protein